MDRKAILENPIYLEYAYVLFNHGQAFDGPVMAHFPNAVYLDNTAGRAEEFARGWHIVPMHEVNDIIIPNDQGEDDE